MNTEEAFTLFNDALFGSYEDIEKVLERRPLLAHYTSLDVVESILKTSELWFSNPLLMNDSDELRFGMLHGLNRALSNQRIGQALQSAERVRIFEDALNSLWDNFVKTQMFDTYVFCFSEHLQGDCDGLLSMWRGYGGNGKGAAVVFHTNSVSIIPTSPLIPGPVRYLSPEDQIKEIDQIHRQFCDVLLINDIPDTCISAAANALFERLKIFTLFTKHSGFSEENEWRIVYLSERDQGKQLTSMLDYSLGSSGIEPKLKLKLSEIEGVTPEGLSLDNLLHMILIGPNAGNELAGKSVERMLKLIDRESLTNKVKVSGIPFRPR